MSPMRDQAAPEQHTPGPWRAAGCHVYAGPNSLAGNREICVTQHVDGYHADHNAAFIVRACNAHADLLAALERLASSEAFDMPMALDDDAKSREIKARLDYARAAITKARQGGTP